jgi:hypothetical protein
MGKHFDKEIKSSQEVVASVGQPAPRTQPRSHAEWTSMLRGFGLKQSVIEQIIKAWQEDQSLQWSNGYDSGYEDVRM